jgi:hypothetical protein
MPTLKLNTPIAEGSHFHGFGGQAPYTYEVINPPYEFVRDYPGAKFGLPTGVSLSLDGTFSGTPTELGTWQVTIEMLDANKEVVWYYYYNKWVIQPGDTPEPVDLTLDCLDPPAGKFGVSYAHSLQIAGGKPPYTIEVIS